LSGSFERKGRNEWWVNLLELPWGRRWLGLKRIERSLSFKRIARKRNVERHGGKKKITAYRGPRKRVLPKRSWEGPWARVDKLTFEWQGS